MSSSKYDLMFFILTNATGVPSLSVSLLLYKIFLFSIINMTDFSDAMIKSSKDNLNNENINYQIEDIEALTFTNDYFLNIEKHVYEDELKITNFDHILRYLKTSPGFVNAHEQFKKRHIDNIMKEINERGSFTVPKKIILYKCWN